MIGKKKKREEYTDPRALVGEHLHFPGAEAYKMLRTNLEFTLTDGSRNCRVIGVTSGLSGEGKSTTSLNLAYSIAETGKTVLLIEADMRQPMLSSRIQVKSSPGLSNVLAGQVEVQSILQKSGLLPTLFVITGGDIPPNPSELLGTSVMKILIDALARKFDYIVIDLPPVNVVTDALVAGRYTDGIVVVVRKGFSTRKSVSETMRVLGLSGIKVLGFVMTCAEDHGKYYYYRKG